MWAYRTPSPCWFHNRLCIVRNPEYSNVLTITQPPTHVISSTCVKSCLKGDTQMAMICMIYEDMKLSIQAQIPAQEMHSHEHWHPRRLCFCTERTEPRHQVMSYVPWRAREPLRQWHTWQRGTTLAMFSSRTTLLVF